MANAASDRSMAGSLRPSLAQRGFVWFLRLFSLFAMIWGLTYWARLIGVGEGPDVRFDLMSPHWRVASCVLAGFYPFAAAGLWMLSSWGPVIYALCAGIEMIMFGVLTDLFGSRPLVIVAHLSIGLLYLAFRLLTSRDNASDRRVMEG